MGQPITRITTFSDCKSFLMWKFLPSKRTFGINIAQIKKQISLKITFFTLIKSNANIYNEKPTSEKN